MGRKKKIDPVIEVKDKELTNEEVDYALNFAKQYMGLNGGLFGNQFGIFNPMQQNANMQNLNFNPVIATSEEIERALSTPKTSEKFLLEAGQSLETQSMLYKRILLYVSRMLSFDLNYVCTNPDVDYKSNTYKKDKQAIINFFDKFDIKDEFQRIIDALVREEIYHGVFRKDYDAKYGIQQLPTNYCMITGRLPGQFLFDFNMSYFFSGMISLDMFPEIFKEFYQKTFDKRGSPNEYNPAAAYSERDGSWAYFVQTSPDDGFWTFKLFPQLTTRIPLFAGLYPDLVLQPLYRQLAKTTSMQAAVKLLVGQVGVLKDSKGGNLSNNFNMDSGSLGRFLQLVRSSIDSVISVSAAPLENITSHEYSLPNRNPLSEYQAITASSSGINSRMLFTSDRQNVFESENSLSVDEYMIEPIYRQFETFLNFYANKETKKHKFKFMLSGTNFAAAKKKKLTDFNTLAMLGIFNPSLAAASMNMNRFDLERMMVETKAEGWIDKLTPIIPSFQQSAGGGGGGKGRPQKAEEDLSEEGIDSRDSGSNLDRGGKV